MTCAANKYVEMRPKLKKSIDASVMLVCMYGSLHFRINIFVDAHITFISLVETALLINPPPPHSSLAVSYHWRDNK
jgi:hypothetical protein